MQQWYVYMMTNKKNGVLYIGMTNNILRRIWEHRQGNGSKFTKKYRLTKVVYYECIQSPGEAIYREKQLKAGSRHAKVKHIESMNPKWEDLYDTIMAI
jgi:putative endonuclease